MGKKVIKTKENLERKGDYRCNYSEKKGESGETRGENSKTA